MKVFLVRALDVGIRQRIIRLSSVKSPHLTKKLQQAFFILAAVLRNIQR